MKLKKELAKVGITALNKITATEKNVLVVRTITSLLNTFPILNSQYYELCMRLYRCDMYRAKIDPSLNTVNYFYKNRAIYFDEKLCLNDINANIIHECIHYIQDVRKQKQKLYRIGLCEFNEYKVTGLGLNEFVLEYITQKIINEDIKNCMNVDDIHSYINTLLNQIIFILGEEIIIKSAINASEEFKEKFMDAFQEEEIYYHLTTVFDKLLESKQHIDMGMNNYAEVNSDKIKDIIYNTFSKIQYNMFQRYFSVYIKYINSIEEIEECKNRIIQYRELIKCSQSEKVLYEKCVQNQLEALDKKFIDICKENSKNTLIVFRNNAIINLFNNIRKTLFKRESY